MKDGNKAKIVEDLSLLQTKYDENKVVWARKIQVLEAEKKQFSTWKVRSLDFEKKVKEKVKDPSHFGGVDIEAANEEEEVGDV